MSSRIASSIAAAVFTVLFAQAARSAGTVYEIDQYNQLHGRAIVIAGKQGIRIELKTPGTVLLAQAPRWDVYFYSPATRSFCMTPFASWKPFQSRLSIFFDEEVRRKKWIRVKQKPDLPCQQLAFRGPDPSKKDDILWTLPASAVGMQPSLIFSRYTGWTFSSPEVAGIPTRLFYKDSQQGPVKVVETYHVRKIVGDKNMFQCPKGLKQVATEQLVVNQRPEEALEIMLGK